MDISTLDLNYLNALDITMPNMSYIDYEDPSTQEFIAGYRDRFKAEPSRFAYQGYDVGMYFLQKLWRTGPFFMQSIHEGESLLSTGFAMQKSEGGGFENTFLYVTGIRSFNLVRLDKSETEN
ncbi:MAG: hypothetical protein U5L96_05840 [Owenweeksia sp.]|nr:hypothetical protein [Owenweeksia sp.]